MTRRVGILGMGAIGQAIAGGWLRNETDDRLVGVCTRPHRVADAFAVVGPDVPVVTDVDALLGLEPDIIVEAAGHNGARAVAVPALDRGVSLFLLSVGILADASRREALAEKARRHGGRIVIPAGALAGFDGIASIARGAGATVRYVSIKPLLAWRGTPAEQAVDLDAIAAATTVFAGNAGEAARLFPKNANLAAAVALAGVGFADTRIELVADPHCRGNIGIVEASNEASSLTVTLAGAAAAGNPKTSAIVADSVFAALHNTGASIAFA